jgi:hypothetical protein
MAEIMIRILTKQSPQGRLQVFILGVREVLTRHSAPSCATGPRLKKKKPKPAKSGSRQVLNSFSPLAFHAGAPLYIPGAKTRIPAELVTCEHICDST